MIISRRFFDNLILFFGFFEIGFRMFSVAILMLLLFVILNFNKIDIKSLPKDQFLFYFLNFSALIFLFLISFTHDIYLNSSYVAEIKSILVFFFLGGVAFILASINQKKYGIIGLIVGLGGYSLYCLWFTYVDFGYVSAYSKVWNPFLNEFENSPSHAINLALFTTLIIYYFFKSKLYLKFIIFCLAVFVIYFGLYTGSRAYILIFPLLMLIYFLLNKNKIRNLIFVIVLSCILFFSLRILSFSDFFGVERLLDSGLESERFNLYNLAINNFIYYPFGGYVVDKSNYDSGWIHNFFLDVARMGGVIPFFLFLLASCIVFFKMLKNYNYEDGELFVILFLVLFFLMQQDVVFTGNYILYLVMLYLGLSLCSVKRNKYES